MKRAMAVVAALALSVLLPIGPMQAVENWHGTVKGATAEWWSTDGEALTGVTIEVANRVEHTPQGAVVRTVGLNLQVIEQGNDPRSGEPLYRQLWTEPFYAPMSQMAIRTLASASATGSVTLVGTEWRGDEERAIGPYEVKVNADWAASGPVTSDRSATWDTQFGAKVYDSASVRSAPATATASVTGDLSLGALGETTGQLVAARMSSHLQPAEPPAPAFRATWRLPGLMDTATTPGIEHVSGAFGFWQVGGDEGTGVLLDVASAHGRNDSGTTATGTLEVYGSYCDTTTNEWVSYDVFSGPLDLTVARIPASLASASVVVTASLTGYESRMSGCANPTGEAVDQDAGPYAVTIRASWTGTGAIEHTRVARWVRGPDYTLRALELNRGRQAMASGTISSVLVSGNLGAPVNAFLYDLRSRMATTGEPPG
ncbi:MAG TPA: hypothetical protein VFH98_04240 [Candidatus Limnocylindria bacterium]|nr:hypothetical protein [Candidatus Limnocylindria bacterium]